MTDVLVGLGSNLGHRIRYLSRALHEIANLPETNVVDVSRAYETKPWGVEDQPSFANAVVLLRTGLRADQLMASLVEIEDRLGRERTVPNGPRTIDLDILLFGDEEWDTPDLVIPHPQMAERDFVITPLLEVAPDATWPEGTPVTRDAVRVGEILEDLGAIPDPGLAEGAPLMTSDWVAIAEGVTVPPDMGLRFKQLVLEQAGIPFTWDPYPPDEEFEPFGLSMPVRLRVPAEFEKRARVLLNEAEQAPVMIEDQATPVDEESPDLEWPTHAEE